MSDAMNDVMTRVRATPELLGEAVERLLDRTVASAIEQPLDVPDADAAYERVRELWSGPANPLGIVAAWAGSHWATRTLHIGKRFSLPVSAILTAVPPLALSLTRGMRELRVLASYVVTRLRVDGVAVDERFVQRVTVNAYCWPERGDVTREHAGAVVRLATIWVTRTVKSDESGVRVRAGARALAGVDLRELSDRFGRELRSPT
jgi:hypothetical protein